MSTVNLCIRNAGLVGGKGGFGSMLKSMGAKKGKETTNFEACRDLNGRRLRNVNDEKKLAEWYSFLLLVYPICYLISFRFYFYFI